jgi:hypothetical protein
VRAVRPVLTAILLSGAVACASPVGTTPTDSETASTSQGQPTDEPPADTWEWAMESPEEHPHVLEDVAMHEGEPDGEPLPDVGSEEPPPDVSEDPPEGEAVLDPCSLVTESEWSDWTGGADVSMEVLEDGDACGWIGPRDELRMAIGVFAAAGDDRWLTSEEMASGEPVNGLADEAWWLEGWPLAQSSTLVVAVDGLDLVIEMSAMQPDQADLLEAARHFAAMALGRLP